jgi:hypothetical protein
MDQGRDKEQLHGLAMGQGVCREAKLWNARGREELKNLKLDHWASRRRDELLRMLDQLDQSIEQLSVAVEEAGPRLRRRPSVADASWSGPHCRARFLAHGWAS